MRFTSPVVTSKDHMGHWGLGVRSKVGKWGGYSGIYGTIFLYRVSGRRDNYANGGVRVPVTNIFYYSLLEWISSLFLSYKINC
jgi:hypothetical protein